MGSKVLMPKFGQTEEEVVLVKWHKKEGERVKKGELFFEIETEKATLEVESFVEGIVLKLYVKEGETVKVQTPVAYVGEEGEKVPEYVPSKIEEEKVSSKPSHKVDSRSVERRPVEKGIEEVVPVAVQVPARLFATPRARKLAREYLIDIKMVKGTGPGGRIREKDVLDYLEEHNYRNIKATPAARRLIADSGLDIMKIRGTGAGGKILVEDVKSALKEKPVKMSMMRRTIAKRLTYSFSTIPHFYVTLKIDMTELMIFRSQLKQAGLHITVNDFILQAVVWALVEYPVMNSSTDGENIIQHAHVDLGIATTVENGLVVPVIRNAERYSFLQLANKAHEIVERARNGRVTSEEITGSTFTVSNMGMLNVDSFAAIINPPEAGILAVASVKKEVVAKDDSSTAVRDMMAITLSADHRVVDGVVGAYFVNFIKNKLENIEIWRNLILL